MLSNYLKPSFLGLLKFLNSMNWFIVFFSLINLSVCIYEDQIGKFDWRQTYVGRIKFAQFDTVSTAKKIIVATEENVLAALHLKTGEVVWRHVFETASAGNIQLLHVSDKVVTVTGANPYLVRGWNSGTGVLLWEWSMTLNDDEHSEFSEWWVQNNVLVHMVPVFGSHLEVTMYNVMKGYNKGSTSKLQATWSNEGCVLTPPYYTCASSNVVVSLDLTSKALQLITKPLSDLVNVNGVFEGSLRPLDGNSTVPGFIIDDQRVVLIRGNKHEVLGVKLADRSASATIVESANELVLLQTWNVDGKGFRISANSIETGNEVSEFQCLSPKQISEPELLTVMCSKRGQHICRLLVNSADDAVYLLEQNGQVVWNREEALANVVAAEFVELPVSETDAAIEMEFDQKEGSVWAAFVRRLHTQYQQLAALLAGWPDAAPAAPDPLVRDYFNLHKIIVLVTDVGKIFGMDNLSGKLLWSHYEPALDTEAVAVFARRSARHAPHSAVLTVVGKHEETGNGFIITLNPIRGTLVAERALRLDSRLLQATVLHVPDNEKLHALLLLDEEENVQVFPGSAAPLVENIYMYVAERETANIQGYALKYDGKSVVAWRTWSVRLGGGGARLAALAARPRGERSRSPGRALPDRSVLYKYANPNLLLAVVDAADPVHKDVVTAVVLDAASGAIITAATHRRARAMGLAVHADNFFAYLYRSDKHRRLEIATIELYEGKQRWLPAGAAFSSFAGARSPGVQRQAYILPAPAAAVAVTVTERSLTDKHLLLALTSGVIMELPWALLEPRRAAAPSAEQREEGLLPYAPELPLPPDAAANYNRTLRRPRALHAAASGLESTCLVLATGLDMFYTRVAPSKTFDLLKDDFEYYLIVIVLFGFLVSTFTTKVIASWKNAKLAWK
ncbi:ER membrane protein complex subunit 1 isoform X2 [Epargyreus clarus]|uniref:ER membrane protein complex subunit 1 isoform X2 n=1 Tax=Epargyreus clarus TaxID=520877 RepID=UPI003C2B2AF6